MKLTRRTFLKTTVIAGISLGPGNVFKLPIRASIPNDTIEVKAISASTGKPIRNARVYIFNELDGTEIMHECTDAKGIAAAHHKVTNPTPVIIRMRKAEPNKYYKPLELKVTLDERSTSMVGVMAEDW